MKKIPKHSSWNLPPTPKQVRAIAKLAAQLGYHEPAENKPSNRWEARNMIRGFLEERRRRNNE
jgi:hypothetical protein